MKLSILSLVVICVLSSTLQANQIRRQTLTLFRVLGGENHERLKRLN